MIFQGKNIFSLLMVIISIVFGYSCIFHVPGKGKIFPLILIILLAVLSILKFLEETFPVIGKHIGFVNVSGIFGNGNKKNTADAKEDNSGQIQALLVFVLILGLIITLYFVHYILTIPVFMAGLLIIIGRVGWKSSLLVSLGTGVFVYMIFTLLLNFNG